MIPSKSTIYSLKGDFHTRALYSFNNTSFISVDFLCPILLTIKIILKSFKSRFAIFWLKVIICFNRVLKWWRHKNEISEFLGFVRIFWKNNVQEAYLPKMTISGQIVSEIMPSYA